MVNLVIERRIQNIPG